MKFCVAWVPILLRYLKAETRSQFRVLFEEFYEVCKEVSIFKRVSRDIAEEADIGVPGPRPTYKLD